MKGSLERPGVDRVRRSLLMTTQSAAPELLVDRWFNTDHPLTLSGLRGRVVVLAAFQVLCPNSIASGVPQARRIYETFAPSDVAVIGMHTTFEHHDAFNSAVLKAFIQEYRLKFPIALDQPNPAGPIQGKTLKCRQKIGMNYQL